ncbi:MAG: hypothetical protein RIA64_10530 [Rhodospirillales bacterium]
MFDREHLARLRPEVNRVCDDAKDLVAGMKAEHGLLAGFPPTEDSWQTLKPRMDAMKNCVGVTKRRIEALENALDKKPGLTHRIVGGILVVGGVAAAAASFVALPPAAGAAALWGGTVTTTGGAGMWLIDIPGVTPRSRMLRRLARAKSDLALGYKRLRAHCVLFIGQKNAAA